MSDASKTQISREGESASEHAPRSQSEIDNASQGSPATEPAQCSGARLEADGCACSGHPQKTGHGVLTCPGCKQEIDPEVCWCGDPRNGYHDGHTFVPMGCDCGRVSDVDVLNPVFSERLKLQPVSEADKKVIDRIGRATCRCDICQCYGEGSCDMVGDGFDMQEI